MSGSDRCQMKSDNGNLDPIIPILTQPKDHEIKVQRCSKSIFPTKYVIPKSLKVSHWLSKYTSLSNEIPPDQIRHGGESQQRSKFSRWSEQKTVRVLTIGP